MLGEKNSAPEEEISIENSAQKERHSLPVHLSKRDKISSYSYILKSFF
jgi:hypothetical protein